MKRGFFLIVLVFVINNVFTQSAAIVCKQAEAFERKLNITEALNKYKEAISIDSNNSKALLKLTEINCSVGDNELKKEEKKKYYDSALLYAEKLNATDTLNINGWYALFIVKSRLIEVEKENKKIVQLIRDTKVYTDRALALNKNDVKANYIQGKWQYDMVVYDWKKRIAFNTLIGKLPEADIDLAIDYLEKAKKADMYYMPAYWVLANAYKQKNRPTQQNDNLKMIIKLPVLSLEDGNIKNKAQKMLNENQ